MIGNATASLVGDRDIPKPALNSSKDSAPAASGPACAPAAANNADWSFSASATSYSYQNESLHMKYTSRDGDVLELTAESTEETYAFAGVQYDSRGRTGDAPLGGGAAAEFLDSVAKQAGVDGIDGLLAAGNTEAADGAEGAEGDARVLQLKRLREWAAEVEKEVRKQSQRILEESLKRMGKHVDAGDGRFCIIYVDQSGEGSDAADDCEAGIPEYWNAENTSDRIVHFATQMAEIAGDDSEFAQNIMQAVVDGFDQANAVTGPLPGAAGELNKKTHDLTMSKLSKWLEDHKAKSYNQGTQSDAISTAEVPHGIENHEQ